MKFGALLKKARLNSGLSQEEMAEKIFLSNSTVSRLESDKIELKARELVRWFQVTQAPELLAIMFCGIDVSTVAQTLTTLIGGLALWF